FRRLLGHLPVRRGRGGRRPCPSADRAPVAQPPAGGGGAPGHRAAPRRDGPLTGPDPPGRLRPLMTAAARKVYFVSLGCPKNRVDSEVMLGAMGQAGHELVAQPDDAEVIVVNTCGFIDAAKEESIDSILE